MKRDTKISGRKKLAILGFALYVTFILLSAIPYIAESQSRAVKDMDSSYTYNLLFESDGVSTHYDVERVDTNEPGTIELRYTTASHTLSVETTNIKSLVIDCNSVYEDESMRVFKDEPSGKYYRDYFIDHDKHFTVNVVTDNIINIEFRDMPKPVKVLVDGKKYTDYSLQGNTIALGTVPKGASTVELYFKEEAAAAGDDDEDGLLGLGKVGGIDVLLILILIIVVIIIAGIALALGKKKKAEEKEEEAEEEEELAATMVEEEVEEEEQETYECPECGAAILEDQANCTECGTVLEWDEEEIEDEDEIEGEGAGEDETKDEGEEGEEDEDEEVEYECPECGESIAEDDTICPSCGAEFE